MSDDVESKKPAIEDVLLDKALMFRALVLNLKQTPFSEDDALRFVERALVHIRNRKNEHVAGHRSVDPNCLFCVDAIYTTNE